MTARTAKREREGKSGEQETKATSPGIVLVFSQSPSSPPDDDGGSRSPEPKKRKSDNMAHRHEKERSIKESLTQQRRQAKEKVAAAMAGERAAKEHAQEADSATEKTQALLRQKQDEQLHAWEEHEKASESVKQAEEEAKICDQKISRFVKAGMAYEAELDSFVEREANAS